MSNLRAQSAHHELNAGLRCEQTSTAAGAFRTAAQRASRVAMLCLGLAGLHAIACSVQPLVLDSMPDASFLTEEASATDGPTTIPSGLVADAGPDQTLAEGTEVTEGTEVMLDGRGSTVPDGLQVSYNWTQTEGPDVTLADATGQLTTFIAPSVPSGEESVTLRFRLSVLPDGITCNDLAEACAETTVEVARETVAGAAGASANQIGEDGTLTVVNDEADPCTRVEISEATSTNPDDNPTGQEVQLFLDPAGAESFAPFAGNQRGLPQSLEVIADLGETVSLNAVVRLCYEEADLAPAGIAGESSLRLLRLDENANPNTWEVVGTTDRGGTPTDTVGDYGVSTDENFVWAVVDGLGIYAIGVPAPAQPPVPVSTGGGGGSTPPANSPPTAVATATPSTATDTDGDGSETIALSGAASSDSDGTITSYVWIEGGTQIATGATPSASFTVGTHTVTLRVTDNDGETGEDTVTVTVQAGNGAPTVTINQAGAQDDPTNASPINFTVVFSEDVEGFTDADVTLAGTAGAVTAVVTGGPATYNVAVSGMTGDGTVIASIGPGVVTGVATGIANAASTSTDNEVTYDTTGPTVTINQASGQADPTTTSDLEIDFTVVFGQDVVGFTGGDVTVGGTAGADTAVVTGGPATYNVAVSGMTGAGTVTASIGVGVVSDLAGNPNGASTSTDNEVTVVAGFPISGQVTRILDGAGATGGVGGVSLDFTGTGESAGDDFVVTPSGDGRYEQVVPVNWTGTVAATEPGSYVLTPADRTYDTPVASAVPDQDYTLVRHYFVETAGNDADPGTEAQAFGTIQHAADVVAPGDTVFVKAGTYREWVKIRASGTAEARILFRNFEDDVVIVDAEGTRFGCILVGNIERLDEGHFVTVDGFIVTGTTTAGGGPSDRGGAATMINAEQSVFRNITVRNCGFFGILAKGRNIDCTIEFCEAFSCARGGIEVVRATTLSVVRHPQGFIIDNCYVHDNFGDNEDADGIQILQSGNEGGHRISNNIIHHNADDGIDATDVEGVFIINNIVFQNGDIPADPPVDDGTCPPGQDGCGDGNGIKVSTNAGGHHVVAYNICFNDERGEIDQDIVATAPRNFFLSNVCYGSRRGLILDAGAGGANTGAVVYDNIFAGAFLDDYYFTDNGSNPLVVRTSDYNFVQDGLDRGDEIPVREGPNTIGNEPPQFVDPPTARTSFTEPFRDLIDTTDQGSLVATMDFIRNQVFGRFALSATSPAIDAGVELADDPDLLAELPAVRDELLARIGAIDDLAVADTGSGLTTPFFDMGAIERGLPELFFTDATTDAPEAGGNHLVTVTVRFDDGGGAITTPAEITVDVIALNGSAMPGRDYMEFGTTTLTFPAGSADNDTQTFELPVLDDGATEGAETVNLVLRNVRGPARLVRTGAADPTRTLHTVTILDDD